ncbi:hypothetical protein ABTY63_23480 [Streptomyces solisilvae]|uniref:hypothetical protein n=1 Tax=Streptomyces malaysiensis TaxID=92644 RepID=UPI0033299F22
MRNRTRIVEAARAALAEVHRRDVEELVAAASALLVEHEPVEALRHWLDRVIDYAAIKRGVGRSGGSPGGRGRERCAAVV